LQIPFFLRLVCIVVSLAATTACTSRQWYESATASAKNDCDRLQPGAREDCLSKVNKTSYDAYEKERSKQSQ